MNNNTISTFTFPVTNSNVRIVIRDGKPWFVAKEVALILGYKYPANAIQDHCKHAVLLKGDESSTLTSSPRGINVIPEGDVYRLITKSTLPAAQKFEEWMMDTIMPSVRNNGGYVMGQEKVATGEMSDLEFVLKMEKHTMNTNTTTISTVSDIVITGENNVPMTTSLKVAEVFDKEHFHVLTAIRSLDCSPDFKSTNFSELSREYRGRSFPYYLMTRDGFTFLAMGFTGARAAEFKEKYIAEFNKMEAYIKEQSKPKFIVPQTMIEAMELALTTMKEKEALKAENAMMLPKATPTTSWWPTRWSQ